MYKFFITIIFIFLPDTFFAQEAKVQKILEAIYQQNASNSKPVDEKILFKSGNEPYVTKYTDALLKDSASSVRISGISVIARVAYKSTDTVFRQHTVTRLLSYFRDADPAVTSRAAKYLTGFERLDFNNAAKDTLRSLISMMTYHYDLLLKLAGFAGIRDKAEEIKSKLLGGELSPSLKWSSILALARMGEEEYISLCLFTVKDVRVNDNFMYNTLPELIYTRQRTIFDYLIELVNSDKADCHSPNPNYSGKILCAYRIMEALAGVIDDFPVRTRRSGDLITDNYEKSLEITRKWFNEHKNDYKINTDRY